MTAFGDGWLKPRFTTLQYARPSSLSDSVTVMLSSVAGVGTHVKVPKVGGVVSSVRTCRSVPSICAEVTTLKFGISMSME